MSNAKRPIYVLEQSQREHQRLVDQARFYESLTRNLLRDAGLAGGMRVLDFGCGVGDVSFLASDLVGSSGHVVGVDRSPEAIAVAEWRAHAAGISNVSFAVGDESTGLPDGDFDALVGRLVLMYQPDPTQLLRSLLSCVRPGGVVAFQELNLASRYAAIPELPLLEQIWSWAVETCRQANLELNMGFKLHTLFRESELIGTQMVMVGRVESGPDSPAYTFVAETIRSMLPLMIKFGVASAEDVDIDTLADRLRAEATERGGIISPSFLVGAYASKQG